MADSLAPQSERESGKKDGSEGDGSLAPPLATQHHDENGTMEGLVDPGRSNRGEMSHHSGDDDHEAADAERERPPAGENDETTAAGGGGGEEVDETGRQLDMEVTMIGTFDGTRWHGKWGMTRFDAEGNDDVKKSSFSYSVKSPATVFPLPAASAISALPPLAQPSPVHGLMDVVLDGSFKMKVAKGEKTVKEHNIVMRFGEVEGGAEENATRIKVRGGGKNHIGPFVLTGIINLATREMRLARWYVAELPRPYQYVAPRRTASSAAAASSSSSATGGGNGGVGIGSGSESNMTSNNSSSIGSGGEEGGKFPQRVRRPPPLLTVDDQQREANKKTTARILQVLERLRKLDKLAYFERPVDPVALNIPTYFDVIKQPMDLGTVRTRLLGGQYSSEEDAAEDIRLTFSNAMTFNPDTNHVHQVAKSLLHEFDAEMEKLQSKALMKRTAAANAGLNSWRNADLSVPPPPKKLKGDDGSLTLPPKSRSGKSGKRKPSSTSGGGKYSDLFGAEDDEEDDEEEAVSSSAKKRAGSTSSSSSSSANATGSSPSEVAQLKQQLEEMQRMLETLTKTQQQQVQQQQQQLQQQSQKQQTQQQQPRPAAAASARSNHHTTSSTTNAYANAGPKPPQPRPSAAAMAATAAAVGGVANSHVGGGGARLGGGFPPEDRMQERPLTYQEKLQLTENISNLPEAKVVRVVQIIRESRAELMKQGGEEETVEIDFESLDTPTLRKLQRVVQDFIREERKMGLKAL